MGFRSPRSIGAYLTLVEGEQMNELHDAKSGTVIVTFKPTMHLAWFKVDDYNEKGLVMPGKKADDATFGHSHFVLKQKWIAKRGDSRQEEWRDIPVAGYV